MSHSSAPLAYIKEEYLQLLKKFCSLHLFTISEGGRLVISYALFVVDQNYQFFIYISALARHIRNLINYGRDRIMLIESE